MDYSVLIATSHSYKDTSLIQIQSWFEILPQDPPVYAIGPLLPLGHGHHTILRTPSQSKCSHSLSNLGIVLSNHFEKLGRAADLEESFALYE